MTKNWTNYVVGDKLRDHILNLIAGGETPESLSAKTPVPLFVIEDIVRTNLAERNAQAQDTDRASCEGR